MAAAAAALGRGYSLLFPGRATVAGTMASTLDPSNAEARRTRSPTRGQPGLSSTHCPQVARLAEGFTLSVWLRFDDLCLCPLLKTRSKHCRCEVDATAGVVKKESREGG